MQSWYAFIFKSNMHSGVVATLQYNKTSIFLWLIIFFFFFIATYSCSVFQYFYYRTFLILEESRYSIKLKL